ncbi:DNA-directed RNA polymerase subunit beta' [PVC group bacterium (ex Bugula neritina AB1)]|nr:DNA-directed RNA polymerase subunit beta' [PVC group bacterium (ex Bugula neritina AB1)]
MSSKNVNTFDCVTIGLASPEKILDWSYGEVKKTETINYRTFRTERDGLFCEKIFGPSKDWECFCGKYKRIKHKGVVCSRCEVEVTLSKVRRERMGHIKLVSPVVHVWFFKTPPSRLGTLLEMSLRSLERVIYFEERIVLDPGETPLEEKQLLSEVEYQDFRNRYGNAFKVGIGAEAIGELLKKVDLAAMCVKLRDAIEKTNSKQVKIKIAKSLEVVESFRMSSNKPEWMLMDLVPVIPPDLRPLVPLDGGRFASSDLNDLYRRVINRNNRLKRLLYLKAPEVILNNEKRMLQEAVDALFDNGKHGRPVLGAGNRPLKSLSDMLKGKQGRFRQNLLGKRVDYSGRSVVVVGPELKLDQCGVPKKMALELFEPFIIRRLREKGFVHTIKSARKMLDCVHPEVWDILEEVIKEHPVMLNRAPTLHRLGIQAFEPVLVEGKAIKVHPLVCTAFNADFDGDQMAIHVPLSLEAQMECRVLMLSKNNIFAPSNGHPITTPTQDMVLGIYYLTKDRSGLIGEGLSFRNSSEVLLAKEEKAVELHTKIKILHKGKLLDTTVGRTILQDILPEEMDFIDHTVDKKRLSGLINDCYKRCGHDRTVQLLDDLKEVGFEQATLAGVSISIENIKIPNEKIDYLDAAHKETQGLRAQYQQGLITNAERHNKVIDIWTETTENVANTMFETIKEDKQEGIPLNSVYIMADSGARGSKAQIRQLAGMRGLMAKPSGEIIEFPITSNFREGLTVLEYFISTHGARKGLADTALKTADSGYLTRRLVDAAQDVIVKEQDCKTLNGILMDAIVEGENVVVPLKDRIVGRIALDNIVDVVSDKKIVSVGDIITEEIADKIEEMGIERIKIRSVLTCEMYHGICAKCYGKDLARGYLVEQGTAVGVIAAQSIGEPGTQLTMRTFHIGGAASRIVEESEIKSNKKGSIKYHNLRTVVNKDKKIVVLNRNAEVTISDDESRVLQRHLIPAGAFLHFSEGDQIERGDILAEWDSHSLPMVTEVAGKIRFEDIIKDVTMHMEKDPVTGVVEIVILEHREDLYPQIFVESDEGESLGVYSIPAGAHILVKDGDMVQAGDILAKTTRQASRTRDITGGLPRVAELFEARKPKNPAIIAEISGTVDFAGYAKGMRKIIVNGETGTQKEYLIPYSKHLLVYKGDHIHAGEPLTDGPIAPHDILRVRGDRALQDYLVNEIQEVYRLQGVTINDKHIEVIVRQMLKKVRIEDSGDTSLLVGAHADKMKFKQENEKAIEAGKRPARAEQILLGITKTSLNTESFISAASFQETTKVLTRAAAAGQVDQLIGLKENVIMGHLVPAGTGYKTVEVHQSLFPSSDKLKEDKESDKLS